MKFLKFISENQIKNGYYDGEKVIEIEKDILEYDDVKIDNLKNELIKSYNLNDIKIINPVNPTKIVCVGLNYKDHAKEMNLDLPLEPKIFIKPSTCVIGNNDKIIYPKTSNRVDYEGELAIIIGKKAKNVTQDIANKYIFGYSIINDVTARDLTIKDEQWTRGKSFDSFAPIGPFVQTEMNPLNQNIKVYLNDTIKQDSNTKNMIFSPYKLLEYISNIMTLYPGDVIATGTPSGVGPMNKNDIIKISIEDIGILTNELKED
jgi:2-keto-4-pentenoate hydratase/2-oxohepta-3-ene-1,7-dioic acid hydratase in catechol pathway